VVRVPTVRVGQHHAPESVSSGSRPSDGLIETNLGEGLEQRPRDVLLRVQRRLVQHELVDSLRMMQGGMHDGKRAGAPAEYDGWLVAQQSQQLREILAMCRMKLARRRRGTFAAQIAATVVDDGAIAAGE